MRPKILGLATGARVPPSPCEILRCVYVFVGVSAQRAGVQPPDKTIYKMVGSRVIVPAAAADRKGIQPVVELKTNGGPRAEIAASQPVTFTATIEASPQTGRVIAAEWDFEGIGSYPNVEELVDFK